MWEVGTRRDSGPPGQFAIGSGWSIIMVVLGRIIAADEKQRLMRQGTAIHRSGWFVTPEPSELGVGMPLSVRRSVGANVLPNPPKCHWHPRRGATGSHTVAFS